ncbi:MAG: methionyl-tRNA formyltransferase [Flavobacterium sp.]
MKELKIVFMGTPGFAVGVLQKIITEEFHVVGVVTAPDKPAGRGQKVHESDVKVFATQNNLPVWQPTSLKDPVFLEQLKSSGVNCQVVVAFRMLPEQVWRLPEFGTFNLHASLLPQYRGAAPINWALMNGETETGVTTFFIDDKIDTGAIILKESTSVDPDENAGSLHDRLMDLGGDLVVKTLQLISNDQVQTQLQEENGFLKPAPKLNKENCKIDWSLSGTEIKNHIRGLSPYPGAWCELVNGEKREIVKIYKTDFKSESHDSVFGTILSDKREIKVAVLDGWIHILEIQLAGKRKMGARELLNGYQFPEGSTLK